MLTAVIVDDNQQSNESLQRMLESTGNIRVIEGLSCGEKVLEKVRKTKPDLLLLDTQISETSGIEVAKKVKEDMKDINIIFVTASKEHAIKAFDLGAADYILKPFNEERIQQTIDRISGQIKNKVPPDSYMIRSFKYINIVKNGTEIRNFKWRTLKARELFIYLVHHSSSTVRKDILIELLWPDMEVEKAYKNLYATIYNIRKTLKDMNMNIDIINSAQGYEIELNDVKYDVFELRAAIDQFNEQVADEAESSRIISTYKRILNIYKGDFLAEEAFIWKEIEKEKLRVLFMSTTRQMIKLLMDQEKYTDAALLALDIQDLYPELDYSYYMLMQLYDKFDDRHGVEKQYNKLKQVLEIEFDSKPSQEISNWYLRWLERQYVK